MESALCSNSKWLFPYGIIPISIHSYILLIDSVSIFYHGITFRYGIICDSIWRLIWSLCPLFGMNRGSMRSKPLSGILYCSLYPLFWSMPWRNILICEVIVCFIQIWVVHWVWWVGLFSIKQIVYYLLRNNYEKERKNHRDLLLQLYIEKLIITYWIIL